MAETGGGSIINISSIYGCRPTREFTNTRRGAVFKPVAYSVSKAGCLTLRGILPFTGQRRTRVNPTLAVFNYQDERFLKIIRLRFRSEEWRERTNTNGAVIFLSFRRVKLHDRRESCDGRRVARGKNLRFSRECRTTERFKNHIDGEWLTRYQARFSRTETHRT